MKLSYASKLVIIILFCFSPSLGLAKNFGVVGEIYEIREKDLLDLIKERLHTLQANHELDKLQNKWRDQVISLAERPTRIELTKTSKLNTFTFIPVSVLKSDIRDATGRTVAAAGTEINPLNYVNLHKVLFFIDADDKKELAWALERAKSIDSPIKWILINGSIAKAYGAINSQVYFDQGGRLSKYFHLRHHPAIVAQKGLQFEVSEGGK